MLSHRTVAMRVAGERKRRISQREDEPAMADAMPVHHRLRDTHRQHRFPRPHA